MSDGMEGTRVSVSVGGRKVIDRMPMEQFDRGLNQMTKGARMGTRAATLDDRGTDELDRKKPTPALLVELINARCEVQKAKRRITQLEGEIEDAKEEMLKTEAGVRWDSAKVALKGALKHLEERYDTLCEITDDIERGQGRLEFPSR